MDWKRIGTALLFPKIWVTVVLALLSAAGLIYVFVTGREETVMAYAVYPVAFYALAAVCSHCCRTLPSALGRVKERLYAHPYGKYYMTDAGYRMRVSLYITITVNLLYAMFKFMMGVVLSSAWLGEMAVYYALLTVMRFQLLRYLRLDKPEKQGEIQELRRARWCGVFLLILHMSLTGIVLQMVRDERAAVYPGYMIFAVAAYTFYSVIMSIVSLVRCRKYESPIFNASRMISMITALVSLLMLETAMIAQFGQGDEQFRLMMTGLTGAAVCCIVLLISILMIVQSTVRIRRLQSVQKEKENKENE